MDARKTAFAVRVPPPGQDHPSWAKVGVIAVVGFFVGIAWPRLTGVRLGPGAPAEATPAAGEARASTGASPASSAAASAPTIGNTPSVVGRTGPATASAE